MSDKCMDDVAAYKVQRSRHINSDILLGEGPAEGRRLVRVCKRSSGKEWVAVQHQQQ